MSGQHQDEHKSHSESLEGQAPTDDPQRQQAGNGGPTSHHEHGAPFHEDAPNPPRPHVHRRRRSSVSASAFVAAKSVQRLLSEVHLGVMRQPRAEEAPAYFRVEVRAALALCLGCSRRMYSFGYRSFCHVHMCHWRGRGLTTPGQTVWLPMQ